MLATDSNLIHADYRTTAAGIHEGKVMSLISNYFKVAKWLLKGKPVPPPHLVKQRNVLENAQLYKTRIMVETGTLLGDMVAAMKNNFEEIYSIEISPELASRAKQRFADNSNVHIIENDSAIALKSLVPSLSQPALFWLDGHYSGGNTGKGEKVTPIMEELATIYSSGLAHVVLIDDARLFSTDIDYPTMAELESAIKDLCPNAIITTKYDCIRIIPGQQ